MTSYKNEVCEKTPDHKLDICDLVELKNGSRGIITEYRAFMDNALYGIGFLRIQTDIVGYTNSDLTFIRKLPLV